MSDLISRQAVIAEFNCCELTPDGGIDANYAIEFLEQLPTAQPDYTMRCNFCDMSICTLEGRPCSRKVVKEGDNK